MLEITEAARDTAGIVFLAAITVTSGGWFLTRVTLGGVEATEFQRSFFRAGHAHAGTLIILGLLCLLFTEVTELTGFWQWLSRTGVLIAAILMPAGFFLSATGPGRTTPTRLIALLWVGAVFLIAGLAACGVGLLLV
ncbi:MAG: hypothetical protein ACTHV8_03395 [Nesterenkonia sp.]